MSTCPLACNASQQAAFDAAVAGKSIFITGPGGTGKSFLINKLYDTLTSGSFGAIPKKIGITALTGCAALLLHPKAKTLHSWAGIGLGKEAPAQLLAYVRKTKNAANWRKADGLIIDEISMMTADLFDKLDFIAKAMRKSDAPFGGLQLIVVGDFFQLPPVASTTSFAFESAAWKAAGLTTYNLTEIVRQKDPVFQTILNEARIGKLSDQSYSLLKTRIRRPAKGDGKILPTMLFTRRAEVNAINMSYLSKLTADQKIFKATTEPNTIAQAFVKQEIDRAVAKLDNDGPYYVELSLCVGAQVMLTVNKPDLGLVNGSRGVVVDFQGELPLVEFRNGSRIPIDYHTWNLSDVSDEPRLKGIQRKQIPLRLAYAITIHKAQGATLDCALIDVGDNTFEYGQAYVALSRVRDMDGLYIHALDRDAFRAHPKVVEFTATHTV